MEQEPWIHRTLRADWPDSVKTGCGAGGARLTYHAWYHAGWNSLNVFLPLKNPAIASCAADAATRAYYSLFPFTTYFEWMIGACSCLLYGLANKCLARPLFRAIIVLCSSLWISQVESNMSQLWVWNFLYILFTQGYPYCLHLIGSVTESWISHSP